MMTIDTDMPISKSRIAAGVCAIVAAMVWAQAASAFCFQSSTRRTYYHDYYAHAFVAREKERECGYMSAEGAQEWDRALAALREKAVAEIGEGKITEFETKNPFVKSDEILPAEMRCTGSYPASTARAALSTQILAFHTSDPHPFADGEICSSPIRGGADGNRHIAQIAELNATLGVEEQCKATTPEFRKLYVDRLAEYIGKLQGATEAHVKLLAEAAKWREWLRTYKRLTCSIYDRDKTLWSLKTIVRAVAPTDQALERRVDLALQRTRLIALAKAEKRWRGKAKLCPLPGSASVLAKLGDGRAFERSVKAEFDPVLLKRAMEGTEKVDPDRCQAGDVMVFASLLEFLTPYGAKLPDLTYKEFKAAELKPTLNAFGMLGLIERCGVESPEKLQKAVDVAKATVDKLPPDDPRLRALEAFRTDVRNWRNAACEDWLKKDGAAAVLRHFGRY
jgi:hypothetical protein